MPAQSTYIADGQKVEATDLNSFTEAAVVLAGEAISSILGVADANSNDAPITVVPGGGMSVTVGALGQKVLVQSSMFKKWLEKRLSRRTEYECKLSTLELSPSGSLRTIPHTRRAAKKLRRDLPGNGRSTRIHPSGSPQCCTHNERPTSTACRRICPILGRHEHGWRIKPKRSPGPPPDARRRLAQA